MTAETSRGVRTAQTPDVLPTEGPPGGAPVDGKLVELARGSVLNLFGAGFSAAATIAITVLVTRLFTKDVAGAFFSATSLFLMVEQIAGLGAYIGAVYFIARLRQLGQDRLIAVILRAAIVPVVVSSVTAMVALLAFALPLSRALLGGHLGTGAASPSAVATTLRALAATLPFATLMDTFIGASRGYRDMRPSVFVNQFGRSLLQLAGVAAAVAVGSAALLAPLWALPYIPAAAAGYLWFRHTRRIRSAARPRVPEARPEVAGGPEPGAVLAGTAPVDGFRAPSEVNGRTFWRFTAPRAVAGLAQIIIQRLDIVLVAIMRGPAEAALYTAATRFLVAGQLGAVAIGAASQPQFVELFAMRALRRANVLYQTSTAWLITLIWPMYLLIMVNGQKFLTLFGHSYKTADSVLIILGFAMLVSSACGQVDVVLITAGKSSWSMVNGLLAMVINVSVDVSLIPHYGIVGAAIGWAAAIVVANLMPLVQIAVSMRLTPIARGMPIACGLCLVCFAAVPELLRALIGDNGLGIGSGVIAGTALMAAGLWYFREPLCLSVMPILSRFLSRPAA